MITTLTGDNSHGWQQALTETVDNFTTQHGAMAVERLDGAEASYGQLTEALQAMPFLTDHKLVVLRSPSAQKQFADSAEHILGHLPETTDVIIVEPKLDKRSAYYKFLAKKTDFQIFNNLDVAGLAHWLTAGAKEQGATLSSSDARYLVERVGTDQQRLGHELDKLILYNPKITRQTIDLLTEATPQSTIFQLLEAAFNGQPEQAMALYDEQRALKVEPQQIIAMLAWQLHVLALLKTAGDRPIDQIAKDARINPFVIRKSQAIARQLSLAKLKGLLTDLLRIDTQTKSTALDADEALKHYFLTLTV